MMGSNEYGQLGINDPIKTKSSPVLVESLPIRRVLSINCGGNMSFVISDEGEVYGWGQGKHGALGIGDSKLKDQF